MASLLFACSTPTEEGFSINFNIPTAGNSPVKVSLEGDSTLFEGTLTDGKLEGIAPNIEPQFVLVQVPEIGQPAVYFHDGSAVNVTLDDSLGLVIEAGVLNDSANAYNASMAFFGQTLQILQTKYTEAIQNGDQETMSQIQLEANQIMDSQVEMTKAFAMRNGIVGAAISLSGQGSTFSYEDLSAILANVDSSYHSAPDYKKLKEKVAVMERSAVGTAFKDFAQNTPEGGTLNVLAVDGKYVLVDFWASWCKPCRAANPALVELYNTYHPKGFNILGVSFDDNSEKWAEGIEQDGLQWPQISDLQGWRNEMGQYYGIQFIPQNLLLDDNGVIVGKNLEPAELGEFLANNL